MALEDGAKSSENKETGTGSPPTTEGKKNNPNRFLQNPFKKF